VTLHPACRWDASYEAVSLADLPHRRLTKPAKVFEQFFDGERKARGRYAWDPAD
jgi:protein arginine N-methyltransferase 7